MLWKTMMKEFATHTWNSGFGKRKKRFNTAARGTSPKLWENQSLGRLEQIVANGDKLFARY
ncbi:hypothetical protein GCM10023228_07120 [Brevibacillus fulvus]